MMNRYARRKLLLGIALLLAVLHVTWEPIQKGISPDEQAMVSNPSDDVEALFRNETLLKEDVSIYEGKSHLPAFIIIVCDDKQQTKTGKFSRQLNQVTVLLKSAVTLSKEKLRFLVVTNSDEVFEQIKSIVSAWPEKYQTQLELEPRSVWYPEDRKDMRSLLRPCSSARLFLPETMKDIDAAVLVDTDTLFLRPPEELLKEIYKFNGSQAAGLAQTSSGYKGRRIPFPGRRGANTGVMVMNMTRLRALPGGWTGTTLKAFDDHRQNIASTATNDIINIAIAKNMKIYYDLDCVWNYGPGACYKGTNTCHKTEVTGAFLLHGTSAAFVNNRNFKFRAVYMAWQNYKMGSPLSKLLDDIRKRIRADISARVRCNKLDTLELMFTKSLEEILRKQS
ncbi:glucoside xylosyltransferase 1-like [Palaemon carinicauda]|uniref:glucoside xylosyltransferase 1-like n=1 Tax=Palaemon carinicauda TaxID=392227 RepID=UPI0035B640D4